MQSVIDSAPTRILFLCPHGAAKSVAAAAMVHEKASRKGLNVVVSNAGTDPDPGLNPIVVAYLTESGMPVPEGPRHVTGEDTANAHLVVNIGCDHTDIPVFGPMIEWNIPDFSDNPDAAFAALQVESDSLVASLVSEET